MSDKDPRERDIRNALYLLRSALQSGEDWSELCDEAYEQALDALVSLTTELQGAQSQESRGSE